jgi:hypothetical protein
LLDRINSAGQREQSRWQASWVSVQLEKRKTALSAFMLTKRLY